MTNRIAILVIGAFMVSGCTRRIVRIPSDRVPQAALYATGATVVVHEKGQEPILLSTKHDPLLRVRATRPCPKQLNVDAATCDVDVTVRLSDVSMESSSVVLPVDQEGTTIVDASDVTGAELRLENTPPFVPTWGLGVDLAGAAILGSISGQWYPSEYVVLEAGLLPPPGTLVVGGWAGLRLRLRGSNQTFWSMGASAGFVDEPGETDVDPNHEPLHMVGPRLAFEYVLPSQTDVLRVEGQAAYGNLLDRDEQQWFPWGGVALGHWF